MPTFSVVYTPPAAPVNFSASASNETSSVTLVWDAYGGGSFLSYRIFRTIADGERELIGTVTVSSTITFTDYLAPIGTAIQYEVTILQTTGAESEAAAASTALEELGWWLVNPGVATETFRLPHVEDYSDVEPVEAERYKTLGRPTKIVVQGDRSGAEGTLRIRIGPEDRALVRVLRAVGDLAHAPVLLLKSPFGEIYQVSLGAIGRQRGGAGYQVLTIPFTEIADRISDQQSPFNLS